MTAPESPRLAEVDGIKALSALAVVSVHAMRPHWDPEVTRIEVWHGSVVAILVTPAFLFCAGCLAAGPRLDRATIGRRLWRLLGPYLLASVLAELYRALYLHEPVEPLLDLLLARAFGPYYFVFHMALLVPLSWLFGRMTDRARRAVWVALLLSGALRDFRLWLDLTGLGPEWGFTFLVRNPLLYWGFFLSGFEYRAARPTLHAYLRARAPRLAVAALAVILAGAFEAWQTPFGHTPRLSYPLIYAFLALALLVPWPGPSWLSHITRWLSERTYSYYLFHLFFVLTAMRLWPQPAGSFSLVRALLHYGAGLSGVTVLVVARDAVRRAK